MRRRDFITILGGVATAWPFAARGEKARVPVVGFLGANTPSTQSQFTAAFVKRLRELGWNEGRNIEIEYRWAEGRTDRYAEIAAEFVRLNVDVIVTSTTEPTVAVAKVTSVIPIVFIAAGHPVRTGLVKSLARPGGNVTGLSSLNSDLAGKRIELLREVLPRLRRLGYLVNTGSPAMLVEKEELETASRMLGVELVVAEIRQSEDILPAFDLFKDHVEALFVGPEPLAFTNRIRINTLALGARLPTMVAVREYVESGGLMSYGTNIPDQFRRAGDYVDKILRGTKPGDIPVEQPTRFDLIINLITAKALGITIPATLLSRADEVLE